MSSPPSYAVCACCGVCSPKARSIPCAELTAGGVCARACTCTCPLTLCDACGEPAAQPVQSVRGGQVVTECFPCASREDVAPVAG